MQSVSIAGMVRPVVTIRSVVPRPMEMAVPGVATVSVLMTAVVAMTFVMIAMMLIMSAVIAMAAPPSSPAVGKGACG